MRTFPHPEGRNITLGREAMQHVVINQADRDRSTANAAGEHDRSTSNGMSVSDSSSRTSSLGSSESRRVTGALVAGQLLGGRYRVVQLMGKGGFGAVYKAHDKRFEALRAVAIKEMSDAHLSPDERAQALKDFRHEANLLVQLTHPNLPAVSDFLEEGGKAYLVMEFVEGRSLERVQEEAKGPLDEALVMGWAVQLCAVLHYLHTRPQPIIFRDIKPSNVMVTADNQIKLIDFGIARVFKPSATKDTTLLGSQGYAPLEQYGRGQSDPRADIYALGATLFDLLTNSLPADAPSRRVQPHAFATPRQLNPSISQATETIILRAMEQDPQDRFNLLKRCNRPSWRVVVHRWTPVSTPGEPFQRHLHRRPLYNGMLLHLKRTRLQERLLNARYCPLWWTSAHQFTVPSKSRALEQK